MSPSPTSNRPSPPRPATPRAGGNRARGAASARAKLAPEQARQEQRRRKLILVVVPLAVVLVAVAALVVVRLTGLGSAKSETASGSAGSAVVSAVTSVPAGVLDQVGVGSMRAAPKAMTSPALTADGKPKVLYVGAEYCPYCAAERWSMVVALSRFGTFTGLGQTASSSTDVYPSTPTLTFHGSPYTSKIIAFTGVEAESNERSGSGYAALDTLAPEDEQTFSTYSGGSYPFVDIGGRYMISGASYDPQVLAGKTHQQVATALADPSSDIAKAVDGSANAITAAICATTSNQPSAVCSSAGVQAAAKTLS